MNEMTREEIMRFLSVEERKLYGRVSMDVDNVLDALAESRRTLYCYEQVATQIECPACRGPTIDGSTFDHQQGCGCLSIPGLWSRA